MSLTLSLSFHSYFIPLLSIPGQDCQVKRRERERIEREDKDGSSDPHQWKGIEIKENEIPSEEKITVKERERESNTHDCYSWRIESCSVHKLSTDRFSRKRGEDGQRM